MKKLLATAVMMLVAAPVFAADIPNPPPVYKSPPPVAALAYNWSGCYVGVGGGYGMWTQPSTFEFPAGVPFTFSQTTGGRGSFFTAQGGCDFQIGNFVIGAFGDGDWGDLKGTANWFNNNAGTQHQKRSWAADSVMSCSRNS